MSKVMYPSRHGVKITVLRKMYNKDLVEKYYYPGDMPPCSRFEVGQEFIVPESAPHMTPEGFCGWAWADIQKIVWGMARGGPNILVASCTDGYRPVVFLLEKIPG